MKGFLEALRPLIAPPLLLAHRFVESERGLAYYAKHPDGILLSEPEGWDTPIFYLAFHGYPAGIESVLDNINTDKLCEAFRGYGTHKNLVYFAACGVLRGQKGKKFAQDFLDASGCRAVIGYTENVDWIPSLVNDLLFFNRFYSDPDPWRNLSDIFDSVKREFCPEKSLGYSIYHQ